MKNSYCVNCYHQSIIKVTDLVMEDKSCDWWLIFEVLNTHTLMQCTLSWFGYELYIVSSTRGFPDNIQTYVQLDMHTCDLAGPCITHTQALLNSCNSNQNRECFSITTAQQLSLLWETLKITTNKENGFLSVPILLQYNSTNALLVEL